MCDKTSDISPPKKTQAEIHRSGTRGEESNLWEISQEEDMRKKTIHQHPYRGQRVTGNVQQRGKKKKYKDSESRCKLPFCFGRPAGI